MASVKKSSHDVPNDQTFPLRKASVSSLGSHRRGDPMKVPHSGSWSATSMNWRVRIELGTVRGSRNVKVPHWARVPSPSWSAEAASSTGMRTEPAEDLDDRANLIRSEASRGDASVGQQGQQDPLRVLDQHAQILEPADCATLQSRSPTAPRRGCRSHSAFAGDGWPRRADRPRGRVAALRRQNRVGMLANRRADLALTDLTALPMHRAATGARPLLGSFGKT